MSDKEIEQLLGDINERLARIYESQFCGDLYHESRLHKRIQDARQALRNRKPVTIKELEDNGTLPKT